MVKLLLAALGCACTFNLVAGDTPASMVAPGVYDVRGYGVLGDGKSVNTQALQQAIDSISREGGGRLVFPAPGRYLTGTIFLKDHITLEIAAGATLLGSQHCQDYRKDVGHCPYIDEKIDRALIYATNAHNIGLTGRGTIHGNGVPDFLVGAPADEAGQRPMLVRFEDCTGIQVNQLTLTECFSWCFHFARCKDVRLDGLSIFNRRQDGIDLESCEDVTVSNCHIKSGDDAIVLLSNRNIPCRNVAVNNCILTSKWAGIRLGPLSYGNINSIAVANCVIRDCNGGGIKIAMLEGGEIRNGSFSNLSMENVVCPILVVLVGNYPQTDHPSHPRMPVGKISHLTFSHITGTAFGDLVPEPDAQSVIFLHGHPRQDLEAIALTDINFVMAGGGNARQAGDRIMLDADSSRITDPGPWPEHRPWGISPAAAMYARHVRGLRLTGVRFAMAKPDVRSVLFIQQSSDLLVNGLSSENPAPGASARVTLVDCKDTLITGCVDRHGGKAFVALEGKATHGVKLANNHLDGFEVEIQIASKVQGE